MESHVSFARFPKSYRSVANSRAFVLIVSQLWKIWKSYQLFLKQCFLNQCNWSLYHSPGRWTISKWCLGLLHQEHYVCILKYLIMVFCTSNTNLVGNWSVLSDRSECESFACTCSLVLPYSDFRDQGSLKCTCIFCCKLLGLKDVWAYRRSGVFDSLLGVPNRTENNTYGQISNVSIAGSCPLGQSPVGIAARSQCIGLVDCRVSDVFSICFCLYAWPCLHIKLIGHAGCRIQGRCRKTYKISVHRQILLDFSQVMICGDRQHICYQTN